MSKKILFDLDGTLIDPKVGVTGCIRYAMEKLNVSCPDDLDWCIGPPLQDSFAILLANYPETKVSLALNIYRDRYSEVGIFENQVYPGIITMLEKLKEANVELCLATSKPQIFSDRIIDMYDLKSYFKLVFGSKLDGTYSDKGELIKYIIDNLGAPKSDYVMVGDRKFDLIGADRNGIGGIGVLWGYGTMEELKSMPHIGLCSNSEELTDLIFGLMNNSV